MNHTLPSNPGVMPAGSEFGEGTVNSVTVPALAKATDVDIVHKLNGRMQIAVSLKTLDRTDFFIRKVGTADRAKSMG